MIHRLIEIIGLFITPFYMVGTLLLGWCYMCIIFVPLVIIYFVSAPIYYIVTGKHLVDHIYAEKLIKGIIYPTKLYGKISDKLFHWIFKDFKHL